jgi:hypothetical protein
VFLSLDVAAEQPDELVTDVYDAAEENLRSVSRSPSSSPRLIGRRTAARAWRVRWALEEVDQPYEVRLVSLPHERNPRICVFILSA